jgi:hypothetical protein
MFAGFVIQFDWAIVPNPEANLCLQLLVLDVYDSWSWKEQLPDHHPGLDWKAIESRERSRCDLGFGMGGLVRLCRHDDQQSEGLLVERK